MPLIDCLELAKIDKGIIDALSAKSRDLQKSGLSEFEADLKVKNEYIVDEHNKLSTELHDLKKEIGFVKKNAKPPEPILSQLKSEQNATTKGEQPKGNIQQHKEGDGSRKTTETSSSNRNEPSGEIKSPKPSSEEKVTPEQRKAEVDKLSPEERKKYVTAKLEGKGDEYLQGSIKNADKVGGIKNQDKSVKEYTLPDGTRVMGRNQPEVVNGFYSPLEKVIGETKFDKLPVKQWIEKFGKGDEAKWTGLTDWLNQQKGTVSKADIQKFLKENRIEVVEVVKGSNTNVKSEDYHNYSTDSLFSEYKRLNRERKWNLGEWSKNGIEQDRQAFVSDLVDVENFHNKDFDTKFSQYQTPGEKTNYKEVLVTMPSKIKGGEKTAGQISMEKFGKPSIYDLTSEQQKVVMDEYEKGIQIGEQKLKSEFRSSHYDEPNILVHLRMNTRTDAEGNKVLFLEEVQSDWGQKGKKEGFKLPSEETTPMDAEYRRLVHKNADARAQGKEPLPQDVKRAQELEDALMRADNSKIPTAPFVTETPQWTKLGLKVALKEAVKQGADKIAWTTGEQQNERYDLSKQVKSIEFQPEDYYKINKKDNPEHKGYPATIVMKPINGGDAIKQVVYDAKQLSDLVGKDIAERMDNGEWKIEGEGLKVGGKGMKGFYGEPKEGKLGIVGEVAKKLFKQEPKITKVDTGDEGSIGYDAEKYDGKQDISVIPGNDYIKKGDWLIKDTDGNFVYSMEGLNGKIDKQTALDDFVKIANENGENIQEGKGLSTQHSITITPELKAEVEKGLPLFDKGGKKIDAPNTDLNNENKVAEYVSKAKSVLESLYPDSKLEVYDNTSDYLKAGGDYGTRGVAISEKGGKHRILLNLEQIKEDNSGKTAFHEAIHPIVYDAFGVKSEKLVPIWNALAEAMKGIKGMEKVFEHIQSYEGKDIAPEGITELLTQVASGNINLKDVPKSTANKIIDLINQVFEALGINIKLNSVNDFNAVAEKVKTAFETGDVSGLKEVIKGKNIDKYITDLEKKQGLSAKDLSPEKLKETIKELRDEGFTEEEIKEALKAKGISEKILGGEGKTVGVHHAALTELSERLGLSEPKRGTFQEPEWYAERGRKLLKAGADPNEVDNKSNELHDRISIARAHLENLEKEADEIGRKSGTDSEEYKKANQKSYDYATDVVKELGTLAHRAFTSLQGERDIDTDSFTSVKRSFSDITGNKPSAEREAKIKNLTETNQKLKQQSDDLEKKLVEETDKAFKAGVEEGKKKTSAEKAKSIANKLRENGKLHKPSSFSAATPASLVWDGAIEVVAKGIEAGGKLADIIEDGLKYIRNSTWYKSLNDAKKQQAEKDFKQFGYDNSNGTSLEDLQARFIGKTDNKFTPEEAKSIWAYAKENYLDKGVSYKEMIGNISDDLGLTWTQVSNAITSRKLKPISDEMWRKQTDLARNRNATKNWVDEQAKNPAYKLLKKVSGVFRGISVFGHGGIFMGTHAGMTLFDPLTWNKTIPAFFRGWKYAYGNRANHARAMEAFKHRDNYILAQRAGLKNNPDRINVGEEYQASQKYVGRLGGAGERGFNAVHVLRQDLFDFHYNKLSEAEKADPMAVTNVAKLVNNATGASNIHIPEALNEAMFAAGMESARWAKLTKNPVKATATALKALITPSKVTVPEKVFAKVWATRVGRQLAGFTSLLLANAAIQRVVNPKNPVNLTNPNESDFLKFKFGDVTLDPTSGMRGVAMFIYGLGKVPFMKQKELKGDTRMQALGKSGAGYGRGKLAPLYATIADFVTQQDYNKNPLPFSEDKPTAGHHKLTWTEYGWQHAPLPVAEAAHVFYESALENGANKPILHAYLNAVLSGGVSGSTGFRVGEYNAEEVNRSRSPFTEEDKKDPTFKYFMEKSGGNLPNVQLGSQTYIDATTKKTHKISDVPKDKQEEYLKEHKIQLLKQLKIIKTRGYVFTNGTTDVNGNKQISVVYTKGSGLKQLELKKLNKAEYQKVESLAQKMATVQAKGKIFKDYSDTTNEDENK